MTRGTAIGPIVSRTKEMKIESEAGKENADLKEDVADIGEIIKRKSGRLSP